jgi:hypothetical protein
MNLNASFPMNMSDAYGQGMKNVPQSNKPQFGMSAVVGNNLPQSQKPQLKTNSSAFIPGS